MSTTIFTFDHGQKKLHKAIGVQEEYLDELSEKVATVIRTLKCDDVKQEMIDCAPSQIVEALLSELSYSQLVLLASFYVRDKVEELEEKVARKSMSLSIMGSDDLPPELKQLLDRLKDKLESSQDDDED